MCGMTGEAIMNDIKDKMVGILQMLRYEKERSDNDAQKRYLAVTITMLEQTLAYFVVFCANKGMATNNE